MKNENIHIICDIDFEGKGVYRTCSIRQESKNKFSLRKIDGCHPRTSLGLIFGNIIFDRKNLQKSINNGNIKIIETEESILNNRGRVDDFKNYNKLIKKYTFNTGDLELIKWKANLI